LFLNLLVENRIEFRVSKASKEHISQPPEQYCIKKYKQSKATKENTVKAQRAVT
jgi:hypothetical protein